MVGGFQSLAQLDVEDFEAEAACGFALGKRFGEANFIFSQLQGNMWNLRNEGIGNRSFTPGLDIRRGRNAGTEAARNYRKLEGIHPTMVRDERKKQLTGARKSCEF